MSDNGLPDTSLYRKEMMRKNEVWKTDTDAGELKKGYWMNPNDNHDVIYFEALSIKDVERIRYALQGSTENRQKARLLLDLHERLDDPDDNVTAEELQTVLMMAAEELEK